jgi:hypothetical protein
MAIISHAFGRVTLTKDDARKFQNQVRHGKPKAAAHTSVAAGSRLAKEMREMGMVRIKLTPALAK